MTWLIWISEKFTRDSTFSHSLFLSFNSSNMNKCVKTNRFYKFFFYKMWFFWKHAIFIVLVIWVVLWNLLYSLTFKDYIQYINRVYGREMRITHRIPGKILTNIPEIRKYKFRCGGCFRSNFLSIRNLINTCAMEH